jgi:hypothetical protein
MKRHRAEAKAKEEKERQEQEAHDMLQGLVLSDKPRSKARDDMLSLSDDESYFSRRRHRDDDSSSDAAVEVLPDRFDKHGKPLDKRSRSRGWTSRSGYFERKPKHKDDWDIKGAWQVGGTDSEAVEQIVRGVTGALEGKGGWLGILGNVLGELHQPEEREAIADGPHEGRRRRRRHRD